LTARAGFPRGPGAGFTSPGPNKGSPKPVIGRVALLVPANARSASRLSTEGSTLTAWRLISQAALR
jgi:hypothetical protein